MALVTISLLERRETSTFCFFVVCVLKYEAIVLRVDSFMLGLFFILKLELEYSLQYALLKVTNTFIFVSDPSLYFL